MIFKYQGKSIELSVSDETTLQRLREQISEKLDLENSSIRLLGVGKSVNPNESGDLRVLGLLNKDKPVMILATKQTKIEEMQSASTEHNRQQERRKRANETLAARARRPTSTTAKQTEYTFNQVKALPYGDQGAALSYLERIKNDKAVKALMAKHRLKVGLLTELDPLTNTEIDHRKLGLNKNAGEVIYLRIRTDAYDGFCNYNEIMLVLCHELAHNTHQDHSPQFWATCKQYEKDIKDLNPWKGGHSLQ